jgi:nicotinamidase-related amidase
MIKAKPYDYPYDGNLDPRATALIVIDMQHDFLSPDGYFARQGYDPTPLRAVLPVIGRLIAACRQAGVRVIHTRQGYRADQADMTPYEKWRRRRNGLEGTDVLLRSSPGFATRASSPPPPMR